MTVIKSLKKKLRLVVTYITDCMTYSKYALTGSHQNLVGVKSEGVIIRLSHSIEKGLCVEPMRLEFGFENVKLLQEMLLGYDGEITDHIGSSVVTLGCYFKAHEDKDVSDEFALLRSGYQSVIRMYSGVSVQGGVKKIVASDPKSLGDGVVSRVSVRIYDEAKSVDLTQLLKVVDIAKNCPSACNRHAIKLYYSLDRHKNRELLELQNGSRSFRHQVPGLIAVTYDVRYQEGVEERNLGFVEGGIWVMSLVTAIEMEGMSSCVLNWCVAPKVDTEFRRRFKIPPYHRIVSFISFGYAKNEQLVPVSIREEANTFIKSFGNEE